MVVHCGSTVMPRVAVRRTACVVPDARLRDPHLDFNPIMILFLMPFGPPEGALMRRHVGGTGCGARGRERTLLPHPGGAGSSARRPLRAARQEHGHRGPTARHALRGKTRRPAGETDGTRKARPGAVRKTPAMARHEAPASLERERGTERTMVAPPGAPSPSPLRGDRKRRRRTRRRKEYGRCRSPMLFDN